MNEQPAKKHQDESVAAPPLVGTKPAAGGEVATAEKGKIAAKVADRAKSKSAAGDELVALADDQSGTGDKALKAEKPAKVKKVRPPHPVRVLDEGTLERGRLEMLLMPLLIVPHTIYLSLWGTLIYVLSMVGYLAAIFTGRIPQGIYDMQMNFFMYATRVTAYSLSLASTYPPFDTDSSYDVDLLAPTTPPKNNRLVLLFGLRMITSIPAWFVMAFYIWGLVFTQWFAHLMIILRGEMPERRQRFGLRYLQYMTQLSFYMAAMSDKYPRRADPAGIADDWEDTGEEYRFDPNGRIDVEERLRPYVLPPGTPVAAERATAPH